MAIAVDLGSISSTSEPVSYAIGVVRDPVVQYTNSLVQIQELRAYYWSQFSNIHDVVSTLPYVYVILFNAQRVPED